MAAILLAACLTAAPAYALSDEPFLGADVTNGQVHAIEADSDHIYLGGSFTMVGPRTGSGIALDQGGDGAPEVGSFPEVAGGTVRAVVPDGSGGWIIGGDFDYVGGVEIPNLARIAADGTVDESWDLGVNNTVNAIELNPDASDEIFIGGSFIEVDGEPRLRLAKIDFETGTVDLSWTPSANANVYALEAVEQAGFRWLYIGGVFGEVNGSTRSAAAAVTRGNGSLTAFQPALTGDPSVFAIETFSGTAVYMGGSFEYQDIHGSGGENFGRFLPTSGDASEGWTGTINGTVRTLGSASGRLMLGGEFTTVYGEDRPHLAMVERATNPTVTDLHLDLKGMVRDLAYAGDGELIVAGDFTAAHGEVRRHLAKAELDFDSGTAALDPAWDPNLNASAHAVAAAGGRVYAGGSFTSAGPENYEHRRVARLDRQTGRVDPSWQPVVRNGVVIDIGLTDDFLYAGGAFSSVDMMSQGTARFSLSDGKRDVDWAVDAEAGPVRAVEVTEAGVYIGGEFSAVDGEPADQLARLSLVDGSPEWTLDDSSVGSIRALVSGPERLVVGGEFTEIAGEKRVGIAAFDFETDQLDDWHPGSLGTFGGDGSATALASDGSDVYFAGPFFEVGGSARDGVARAGGADGALDPQWRPNVGPDVYGLAASSRGLLAVGSFGPVGPSSSEDAALISQDGSILEWAPDFGSGAGGDAAAMTGGLVMVGGYFNRVGPNAVQGFAMFTTIDTPQPIATDPPSPSSVNTPFVQGVATEGSTVTLYTDPTCTEFAPAASGSGPAAGSASEFNTAGIATRVADDTETSFWAKATNSYGDISDCSVASVTYTHETPEPAPPTPPAPSPPPTPPAPPEPPAMRGTGIAHDPERGRAGTVRQGRARIVVRCLRKAARCAGTVRMDARIRNRAIGRWRQATQSATQGPRRWSLVAVGRYNIRPGRSAVINLRLTKPVGWILRHRVRSARAVRTIFTDRVTEDRSATWFQLRRAGRRAVLAGRS